MTKNIPHVITTALKIIDPVTGQTTSYIGRKTTIVLTKVNTGVIKDDGRVVYRDVDGYWTYEPPGRAILSRNYPAMAPRQLM